MYLLLFSHRFNEIAAEWKLKRKWNIVLVYAYAYKYYKTH